MRDLQKLRRTIGGIEESVSTGTSNYLQRFTDILLRELRAAAPKDLEQVADSLDIRVLRDTGRRAELLVLATSPHAQFTERWPIPHPVSMEKHPEVADWAMRHGIRTGSRYLWVYGSGGAAYRTPQFWFRDTVERVFNEYGVSQLLASMEESFSLGRGWWGQREAHREKALLGWARRRAGG